MRFSFFPQRTLSSLARRIMAKATPCWLRCTGSSIPGRSMKHRTTEEKLADDARLLRAWKKWHAEERAAVLAGPHGSVLVELFRMLENLKHV